METMDNYSKINIFVGEPLTERKIWKQFKALRTKSMFLL